MRLWEEHNNSSASPQRLPIHLHKSTHRPPYRNSTKAVVHTRMQFSQRTGLCVQQCCCQIQSQPSCPFHCLLLNTTFPHKCTLLESDCEATILEGAGKDKWQSKFLTTVFVTKQEHLIIQGASDPNSSIQQLWLLKGDRGEVFLMSNLEIFYHMI